MSANFVTVLEYLFLTFDILANAFVDYLGTWLIHRLAIYFVQDLCLVLSLIILFLLFFRSKILRQGLLRLLLKSQWLPFAITFLYISLTIALQVVTLTFYDNEHESKPYAWMESDIVVVLFFIHRIVSAFYYFFYRQATSKLHNPVLLRKLQVKCLEKQQQQLEKAAKAKETAPNDHAEHADVERQQNQLNHVDNQDNQENGSDSQDNQHNQDTEADQQQNEAGDQHDRDLPAES